MLRVPEDPIGRSRITDLDWKLAGRRSQLTGFNASTNIDLPSLIQQSVKMGGGKKIPYPKHVWSPSGGWYAQPANWKRNTAIAIGIMGLYLAASWKLSAELEYRYKMPEPDRFFPSRYWSRQIIEYEKAQKEKVLKEQAPKENSTSASA